MSNNAKDLRKQLKNLVKEELPVVVTTELYVSLKSHIDVKIKEIEDNVKKTLHEINERHKDTMSYLVRQVSSPKKPE